MFNSNQLLFFRKSCGDLTLNVQFYPTMAGLASARARGRLGGRPKLFDHQKTAQAHAMHKDNSLSIKDICKTLGISKTTFYRYISIKSKKNVLKPEYPGSIKG